MRMTAEEIERHETSWKNAVSLHETALSAFIEAEKALARARHDLTQAERARAAEWRKLSQPQ